jgi:hypothetical protein
MTLADKINFKQLILSKQTAMKLSKRNKKVAREVIEKGLQIEFADGLKQSGKVISPVKQPNLHFLAFPENFSTPFPA